MCSGEGGAACSPLGPVLFPFIYMQLSAKICKTRKHSIRMRTVRCGGHLAGRGGGGLCLGGCLPRGSLPRRVSTWGVCLEGVSPWGREVSACLTKWVSAQGSVCLECVHFPLDLEADIPTCEQNGNFVCER